MLKKVLFATLFAVAALNVNQIDFQNNSLLPQILIKLLLKLHISKVTSMVDLTLNGGLLMVIIYYSKWQVMNGSVGIMQDIDLFVNCN